MSFTQGFEKVAFFSGVYRAFGNARRAVGQATSGIKQTFQNSGTKNRIAFEEGRRGFSPNSIGATATKKSVNQFKASNPSATADQIKQYEAAARLQHQNAYLQGMDAKKQKAIESKGSFFSRHPVATGVGTYLLARHLLGGSDDQRQQQQPPQVVQY